MQTRDTFVRRNAAASSPQAFTYGNLAPALHHQPQPTVRTRQHDSVHQLLQSMQARAHQRTIETRRSAAFYGDALRLAALRRHAPVTRFDVVRRRRTDRSARESAPCKARPPALVLNEHPCRERRPHHAGAWQERFRRPPRLTSGPPRERIEPLVRARMPFTARDPSVSIRPGLAAIRQAYARLLRASCRS